MRFVRKLRVIRGSYGSGVFIPLPENTEINEEVEYEVTIEKPKKKRSLTSNSYAWVLCQKIAEKLTQGGVYHNKEDVYRKCIKDCGHFVPVPVRDDVVTEWQRRWGHQGIGWVSEDLGPCKNTPGYTLIAMYHGSSTYTTEEMTRLLECLIDEAKRLDIETKPEEDVNNLLEQWDKEYEAKREKA